MSKIFQAFLSGVFISFILDFFIFLGIFQNYIKVNGIDVYYNILFVDNQNIFLFLVFSAIFGYLVVYIKNYKISILVVIPFIIFALSMQQYDVGNYIGKILLSKTDVRLKAGRYEYHGDILYIGRKDITFYDDDLKKTIVFKKENIR